MTLTVKNLTERFAVSEGTVRTWIKSGELKAVNVAPRLTSKKPKWRVSEQALAEFELLRTATPPAPRVRRRKVAAECMDFIK